MYEENARRTDAPTVLEAREAIVSGEISSLELTDQVLGGIEELDRRHNAFRVVFSDAAYEDAVSADERIAASKSPRKLFESQPLLGIPIAVKDDVDVAGETTSFGCDGVDRIAASDAEVVRRLREAGAVVIGKTHAPEVGQWHFTESETHGATTNPWNRNRSPGGSSGGAAAAVSFGAVPAAIGSDGAGSIRIPAAWTGLVGIKPQRGRVSTWPEPEAFEGLSCYGPLTRTAQDAALLLDAIHGNASGDRHQPPPPPRPFEAVAAESPPRLRIALSFKSPPGVPDEIDPGIREATERIATLLEGLGHDVEDADPAYGAVSATMVARGMAGVDRWIEQYVSDPSKLEPRTRTHARQGRLLGRTVLGVARRAEPSLRKRMTEIYNRFDVVLTPTTAKPAPAIGHYNGSSYWPTSSSASAHCPFAWAWNVIGLPAVSIPSGLDAYGVPIGAQLLGRENDEATLLSLAAQVQEVECWQERRPEPTRPV